MNTPLFKSLIVCKQCGWNYKYKNQRNTKNTYVCGGASTKGKEFCNLKKIEEWDLIFLIKTQLISNDIEWIADNEYISNHVKQINIYEDMTVEIIYHKLSTTLWTNNSIIHNMDNIV